MSAKRLYNPLEYIKPNKYYLVSYKKPKIIKVIKMTLNKWDIPHLKSIIKDYYPKTHYSMDIVKGSILLKYVEILYVSRVRGKIHKYHYDNYLTRKQRKLQRERERRARKPKKLKYNYPKDCITQKQKNTYRKNQRNKKQRKLKKLLI
jgi:hypothetical protein